mgnify:CR=1 FL=1
MKIVRLVIKKVAEKKGITYDEVWKKIKKGYFSGEMMHLRDVEDVFGHGSLRFLGALGSGEVLGGRGELNQKFYMYFKTDDKSERNKIAREVLNERERLKYKERQK